MRTLKIEWNDEYDADNVIQALETNSRTLSNMSIVMAYRNRSPICIRMFKQHDGWITDSKILRTTLDEWIYDGHGDMLAHFRGHHVRANRIRNEMYPAKMDWMGNDDAYVFYLGKYGSNELWNTVNQARSSGGNVPESVALLYVNNQLQFDEYVRYTAEDDDGYEEEDNYRSYRIIGWHHGDITYDKFTVGTDGGWGQNESNLPNDCRITTWGYINED